MALLSKLDSPLYLMQGKSRPKAGDLGIELELEGTLTDQNILPWLYKAEGSLRGGGEYVLKSPVTVGVGLDASLLVLQKALDSCRPKISLRCSTHIHVNVLEKTARQVYQACLAYYLLEPLLVESQPPKRRGNLFCLRMQDAESVTNDIMLDMEQSLPFDTFTKERHRYAALNLVAVHKFGSLEFRFLDAFKDTEIIKSWSKLFYNLVNRGGNITPLQLLKLYDELSPDDFVQTLLGPEHSLVTHGLGPHTINSFIHMNYDSVFELAHKLNSMKFELPRHMWNEDLVPSDEDGVTATAGFNQPSLTIGTAGAGFAQLAEEYDLNQAMMAAEAHLQATPTPWPPMPPTFGGTWDNNWDNTAPPQGIPIPQNNHTIQGQTATISVFDDVAAPGTEVYDDDFDPFDGPNEPDEIPTGN